MSQAPEHRGCLKFIPKVMLTLCFGFFFFKSISAILYSVSILYSISVFQNEVSKMPVPRLKSCNSIKSSVLESSHYSLKII